MGIPDLLWACPRCGRDRGLRSPSDDVACTACGTRFDRVDGARIRARKPGPGPGRGPGPGEKLRDEEIRTAAEWVDALPDPATLLHQDPIRMARVSVQVVERWETVRARGRYVNRIEIFGEKRDGTLELGPERLICLEEGRSPVVWEFGDLRAVQASSRSLQINGAPHPLASFAFLDDSSFLWEQLVALAVGGWYRRNGKGEVVELQPRIVTR